jgi:hypothetical protein
VFATVFRAREEIVMPPPGDQRPARMRLHMHDVLWDVLYAPIGRAVGWVGVHSNRLQFLSIRKYLSLVFTLLIVLLLAVVVWQ